MKNKSLIIYCLFLFLLSTIILALLVSPAQAKKRCKPLLEKLHNVQAMQRNSYSAKRGQSLRSKEDKARDKWWQCENSSRFSKGKNKEKKKAAKKRIKSKKSVTKRSKQSYFAKRSVSAPFSGNEVIVIKSKYQGAKKFAWLDFYQQPNKCQRPKSLTVFASCSEDKQAQQLTFEQQYSNTKLIKFFPTQQELKGLEVRH